jgi:uncharacterized phage protein (TIGR01671 family)
MREIKFRAWDKELKEMIFDIQNISIIFTKNKNTGKPFCFGNFLNDKNYNVMQYIGTKDDKNNEIYDGDIIIYDTEDGSFKARIEFKNNENEDGFFNGWAVSDIVDAEEEEYDKYCDKDGAVHTKVIGNIYENPELLEQQ